MELYIASRGDCWIRKKQIEKSENSLPIKGLKDQVWEFRSHGFAKSGDQEGKVHKKQGELIRERLMKAGTPDRKFSYKVQIYEKQQWKRRGCKMSKRYSEGINYLF